MKVLNDWKRIALIGIITALASQLYWNLFTEGFRISLSVMLLPILLMTLGKQLSTVAVCSITAVIVYLFRLALALSGSEDLGRTAWLLLPNAFFYVFYGFVFRTMVPDKHTASFRVLFPSAFCSDFFSNLIELCITARAASTPLSAEMAASLAVIGLFRSLFAGFFLIAEVQYRTLLKKEEHENRYRRLFLMTTGLKNEIYFMKKNSEEIESVMANAYRLYERLSVMDVADEMKQMSLSIARDVHEIKKDYIRIIQGIEEEISEEYDEKRMNFQDILNILEATTYHLLEGRNLRIRLSFQCGENFVTEAHYELMAVLKNLVNNAIEAIEADARKGSISIQQQRDGSDYLFLISDDGPGISPKHLPNIFKMGYSTKFDYKTGNIFRGVGLYGVKSTVEEQFHGSISVKSVKGKGTVFTIRIPVASL